MKDILVSNVLLKNIWVPKYQKFPHLFQLSTVTAMMKIDILLELDTTYPTE